MRQTILLADDSSTIQRLVTQTFADTRFDIVSVSNGDAAIRKFEELHPDVVLADIYMPGKNGFEVCAHIKAHATLSQTPVILLVGAYDPFDEGVAIRSGASAHITKPFEPRALIELVKSVASGGAPRSDPRPGEPKPARAASVSETASVSVADPAVVSVIEPVVEPIVETAANGNDLLGLAELFQLEVVTVTVEAPPNSASLSTSLSNDEIDRIADRVIHKLSIQVVENIAWDVVPDIAAKIVRDELNKTAHEG